MSNNPEMLPLHKHRSRSPPPANSTPRPNFGRIPRRSQVLLVLFFLIFICGLCTFVLYSLEKTTDKDRTSFWPGRLPSSPGALPPELLWLGRDWQPLELKGHRLTDYLGEKHQEEQCRVSKQGRQLVVDDRGVVCNRQVLHSDTHCCPISSPATENLPIWRYTCHHCQPLKTHEQEVIAQRQQIDRVHAGRHGSLPDEGVLRNPDRDEAQAICCSEYEGCVSCCMEPLNRGYLRVLWQNILATTRALPAHLRPPFAMYVPHIAPEDWFTFCSLQCRTDSSSVVNENTYRHADLAHCFGA